MLPMQLLRVRVRGSRVYPVWARGTDLELEVAERLISVFEEGKTLKQVHEEVEELEQVYESAGLSFKFVRGLSLLLERESRLESPPVSIEPSRAREVVFRIVNERYGGFVTSERGEAIRLAALELGVDPGELERILWADSEENLFLSRGPSYDPMSLLRRYNLSLLQTVLFRALRVTVRTRASGSEVKRFLRAVKRLGLMYVAEKSDHVELRVDGPASVLKMTTKYGVSLAKSIPYVISMSDWHISAEVLGRGRRKDTLHFTLSSSSKGLFPEDRGEEPVYDSSLERSFSSIAGSAGWIVIREPEPLLAGNSLLIPDFLIKKGSIWIYVEVMGFWTPDYVEKKIRKISEVKEPILILVRRDLLCSKVMRLPKEVIAIEGSKIDKVSLLRELERIERKLLMGARKIGDQELLRRGDILSIEELTEDLGLTREQLRELLDSREYALLGDYLVRRSLLERLRGERLPRSVRELKELLREIGLPEEIAVPLANYLGYEVVWRGLDEDDAEIRESQA